MGKLASLVRKLVVNQHQATVTIVIVKNYGIYSLSTYLTDQCPTLLEDESIPQAYLVGKFPNRPQPRYNLYFNSYNPS